MTPAKIYQWRSAPGRSQTRDAPATRGPCNAQVIEFQPPRRL
jgi:hypothetical protein